MDIGCILQSYIMAEGCENHLEGSVYGDIYVKRSRGRPRLYTSEEVKQIRRENANKHYQNNREEVIEKKKTYYLQNRDRILQRKRNKYAEDKLII